MNAGSGAAGQACTPKLARLCIVRSGMLAGAGRRVPTASGACARRAHVKGFRSRRSAAAVAQRVPEPVPVAPRESAASAGPFSAHRVRVSVTVGTGWSRTATYGIFGGGVGYYIIDGLEVGIDYDAWIGAEPFMQRLSPGLRYVFHFVPTIKPYVGTFYRYTFVSGFEDIDHLGARAGIYFAPPEARIYVGGGAVYERVLECADPIARRL